MIALERLGHERRVAGRQRAGGVEDDLDAGTGHLPGLGHPGPHRVDVGLHPPERVVARNRDGHGLEARLDGALERHLERRRLESVRAGEHAGLEARRPAEELVEGRLAVPRQDVEAGVRHRRLDGRTAGKRVPDIFVLDSSPSDDAWLGLGDLDALDRPAFAVAGDAAARLEPDDGVTAAADGFF